MLLIRFFFLCCSEFYICSSGGSLTSVIFVSGGVTLFAERFGAGTGVIKNIVFAANLIVSGGLAAYCTFWGVLWISVMFLEAVVVLGFFYL